MLIPFFSDRHFDMYFDTYFLGPTSTLQVPCIGTSTLQVHCVGTFFRQVLCKYSWGTTGFLQVICNITTKSASNCSVVGYALLHGEHDQRVGVKALDGGLT